MALHLPSQSGRAGGRAVVIGTALLVFLLAACGGGTSATTVPVTTLPAGAVIAEFETPDGERYRILLEGEAAEAARRAFAAGDSPGIPNGRLQPGDGGVNPGHDWHVVEVEFADVTIEVCDGTVSYVDSLGYEGFVAAHGERFCPWMARLVDLIDG